MHGNEYQKTEYCCHIYCIYWHNSNCGLTAKTVAWKFIWQVLQTPYVPWKSVNPLVYVLSRHDIHSRWDFPLPVNTEISMSGITTLRVVLSILYYIFSLYILWAGIQGTWTFKYSGMWRHVTGKVAPNILKDYSAFIFRVNNARRQAWRLRHLGPCNCLLSDTEDLCLQLHSCENRRSHLEYMQHEFFSIVTQKR